MPRWGQVVGSKRLTLFAPADTACVYPHEGMMSNTSQVDVDNPDLETFPLFARATRYTVTLRAGEMCVRASVQWPLLLTRRRAFRPAQAVHSALVVARREEP